MRTSHIKLSSFILNQTSIWKDQERERETAFDVQLTEMISSSLHFFVVVVYLQFSSFKMVTSYDAEWAEYLTERGYLAVLQTLPV